MFLVFDGPVSFLIFSPLTFPYHLSSSSSHSALIGCPSSPTSFLSSSISDSTCQHILFILFLFNYLAVQFKLLPLLLQFFLHTFPLLSPAISPPNFSESSHSAPLAVLHITSPKISSRGSPSCLSPLPLVQVRV